MKDKTNAKLTRKSPANAKYERRKRNYYDYEFGNEEIKDIKNSNLLRSATVDDTNSYSGDVYDEEYARDIDVMTNRLKRKHQENLRQNYNIEFSDDNKISNENYKRDKR